MLMVIFLFIKEVLFFLMLLVIIDVVRIIEDVNDVGKEVFYVS